MIPITRLRSPADGLVIFLIHRSILHSFFFALNLFSLGMYESDEELLYPEEIRRRFKKVFGREMTRAEREVFFMPVEPSPEQEDES
jgi:hypothetical protein